MNHVVISGHLGKDIDLRIGENNRAEGEISVAVNDYIGRDDSTGDAKYWTTWVTCVIYGDRARALQDQLYKRRFVCVSGQMRTRNYKVAEGKTMPLTYILVDHIEFDRKANPAQSGPDSQKDSP